MTNLESIARVIRYEPKCACFVARSVPDPVIIFDWLIGDSAGNWLEAYRREWKYPDPEGIVEALRMPATWGVTWLVDRASGVGKTIKDCNEVLVAYFDLEEGTRVPMLRDAWVMAGERFDKACGAHSSNVELWHAFGCQPLMDASELADLAVALRVNPSPKRRS